jgi:hypothetical protein
MIFTFFIQRMMLLVLGRDFTVDSTVTLRFAVALVLLVAFFPEQRFFFYLFLF